MLVSNITKNPHPNRFGNWS